MSTLSPADSASPDYTRPLLPQLKEATKLATREGMRVVKFRLGAGAWALLRHELAFGIEPPGEDCCRPPPPQRPVGHPVRLFNIAVTRDLMVEWVELDLKQETPFVTKDLREVLAQGASR